MATKKLAALTAAQVHGVSLHYGLTAFMVDTSVNWSFLQSIRDAFGQIVLSQEPSTQVKMHCAQNATLPAVDAANEAARILLDAAIRPTKGSLLALFQDEKFVGVFDV